MARQLAWWLQQLGSAGLQALLPRALPLMLACMEDPSPPVQRMGLAAFQHLATGVPPVCAAQRSSKAALKQYSLERCH